MAVYRGPGLFVVVKTVDSSWAYWFTVEAEIELL